MGSIISLSTIQTALELGVIYSLVALALFLSYTILDIADLTTDGTGDDAAIAACGGSMQVFLQRIEPEE